MKLLKLITPVNQKKIYFDSFGGSQFNDNPRAIYEYVQEHYPAYDCYWGYSEKHYQRFENNNLQLVKRGSFKWMITLLSSKYWVSNSRLPGYVYKSKKNTYIQTWHGTPLKKLVLDMEQVNIKGTTQDQYIKEFLEESSKWDYLISPNSYSTEIFKRCFDFKKEIIEIGYPRNDFLVTNNNEANIRSIKKKLNIPAAKKVILYAPTWRDQALFKMPMSIYQMQAALGEEYVILTRWHYLVTSRYRGQGHEEFVIDVTDYPDIKDLYLISDILVTDYSSVFFDYAILNRPIIFYCFDYAKYKDELRGFYFNLEKNAPSKITTNTEELIEEILNVSNQSEQAIEFFKTFSSLEKGTSAQQISDIFFCEG